MLYTLQKLFLFVFVVLFSVSSATASTLVIGSISSKPAKEIKRFKPLVNYLTEKLKPIGVDSVKLKIATSIDEMAGLMKSGEASIFLDSPFPSLELAQKGVSTIELRRWKKGVEKYHSVIFVRKDSGIDSLDDLKGKIIGFEEEFSTSAFYIPKASLLQQGFAVNQKSDRHAEISANEIGYLFTDDDRNTATWVRKKRVDAGAFNNNTFDGLKDKFRNQLKVIYRSVSVPRQVVNFSIKLPENQAVAIRKALLDMDKTEEGRALLKAFERTVKFDEFPRSIEEEMAPLKKLAEAFK